MTQYSQLIYLSQKAWKNHLKFKRKRRKLKKRRAGEIKHQITVKRTAELKGRSYKISFSKRKPIERPKLPLPNYSDKIRFLASVPNAFSKRTFRIPKDGILLLPPIFSLTEGYEASCHFLKRLFVSLYEGKTKDIKLDYSKCDRIDVDASICMDIILADFISYITKARGRGYSLYPYKIEPINYQKDAIKKALFSIGAFRNIRGIYIKFDGVHSLPPLENNNKLPKVWEISEVHQTQIVEYIKSCLSTLDRELTTEAETELYKVIGEIMNNAEEHATIPNRFAIGMFEENYNDNNEHFGTFNFSILNFGDTIYETFKSPSCKNPKAVNQMSELSKKYTQRGWFRSSAFTEETLWTLYALQEGVTSKKDKRGNGSIQYIENFFRLKGDMNHDNVSKLVILSGNTRIIFDGAYGIVNKADAGLRKGFKMITFNKSEQIDDLPDEKYVTFAPHFFPGTIITARILIKHNNTKQ